MTLLLWNLLLAITWAIAIGKFTLPSLVVGFMIGYLVLFFCRRVLGGTNYFVKMPQVVNFVLFYVWQLILSNLRVAYDIITPTHYMKPGVIAVELDAETDAEITLLANLITLTPGTLSLDLSSDRKVLFVHTMYIDDNDIKHTVSTIKEGLERRVLEVLR